MPRKNADREMSGSGRRRVRRCGGSGVRQRGGAFRERWRRQVKRLERTGNNAQMPKHRTKDSETGAVSCLDTDPGARWRPVVHRAVAMIAIVHAGAYERRSLGTGNEERRHEDQRGGLDDEPDRGGRPGDAADARHRLSVHVLVRRWGAAARDSAGTGGMRRASRRVP